MYQLLIILFSRGEFLVSGVRLQVPVRCISESETLINRVGKIIKHLDAYQKE
jgi:hypothetical protein